MKWINKFNDFQLSNTLHLSISRFLETLKYTISLIKCFLEKCKWKQFKKINMLENFYIYFFLSSHISGHFRLWYFVFLVLSYERNPLCFFPSETRNCGWIVCFYFSDSRVKYLLLFSCFLSYKINFLFQKRLRDFGNEMSTWIVLV